MASNIASLCGLVKAAERKKIHNSLKRRFDRRKDGDKERSSERVPEERKKEMTGK
jgi:hypothetical protein